MLMGVKDGEVHRQTEVGLKALILEHHVMCGLGAEQRR